MFDSMALAEPPDDDWFDVTADWPVLMAERIGPSGEALTLLSGCDPAGLSDAARVSALSQLVAIEAHLHAVRARYTVAIAGPPLEDARDEWTAHEIALAARCSVYAADSQIRLARDLAGRLSATFAALELGRITYSQARALSEGMAQLGDELAAQVEAQMLKFAWRQDLTKFKICLRRWIARLDPDFAAKAKEGRKDAQVEHTALNDGTGELFVRGPLEKTALIDTALSAYAAATKSALGGTTASRKLAALTQWAEDYLTAPGAPRRHGRAYGVNLVLDAPTIFGVANHPAEIPGYGMVPAEAALDLLAEGSPIRRLIIDETDGHLLDYGTTTYLLPPRLADHLIALHQTSAGPHSTVPAAGCDYDHNIPFGPAGGTTDPDNLTPLDRRWHRAKTHAGWTYLKNKDGSVTWTSRTARSTAKIRTTTASARSVPALPD
ncbi:MAG TPA: DUF222 domain-containing protein [Mycobacteriales bacterium]|nr:DUF222 domain-containing protein [Mycobacteriales bacterium]